MNGWQLWYTRCERRNVIHQTAIYLCVKLFARRTSSAAPSAAALSGSAAAAAKTPRQSAGLIGLCEHNECACADEFGQLWLIHPNENNDDAERLGVRDACLFPLCIVLCIACELFMNTNTAMHWKTFSDWPPSTFKYNNGTHRETWQSSRLV